MRTRTLGLVVACALAPVAAQAAPAVRPPIPVGHVRPAPKRVDVAALAAQLAAADDEAAARAAADLGASVEAAAHDALLDALAMGVSTQVIGPVIDAVTQHPAPPDVGALARYATHHNPGVRATAIQALAMYPDPAAHAAVVAGLHDAVGLVRGASAAAAARGRVKEAIDPLFQLLARGEDSSAKALAQLADAALVAKIADHLGQVPDASLALCLGLVLKRPDFGPDPARVEVVRAIGKIQDPAALTALTDYLDATPKNPPRPSRGEAERMVDARLGGGK